MFCIQLLIIVTDDLTLTTGLSLPFGTAGTSESGSFFVVHCGVRLGIFCNSEVESRDFFNMEFDLIHIQGK